jgi:galactokinase
MDGNTPKPYSEVKKMLHSDLARQWAAYVVGCLHVLMHEKDVRVRESIAILIDSEVPQGSVRPHSC